ncbi:adenine deaminase [Enterocloster bolteae]|uniref:adenine deaminase n=1 Tax=Enterocloster bolteae TaxID=208479 RepID=UPI00290739A1|nr:adenine deaminase [Enterocloster bolteae]MDU3288091.1 adenine deaminase [Enterocloster bolteae]
MRQYNDLKKMMDVAAGRRKASLVLKGGTIVNVFTERTEIGDIAIEDGCIAGIGEYDGLVNVDMTGRYICPGFIDGHIHIESSMVSPPEFEKAVLPHGTTTVITDPHEIGNVAGCQGVDYMLKATEGLSLDTFFVMPSCVPSTGLDESGAVLGPEDIKPYYENPRVLGLAEVMNSVGVVAGQEDLMGKLTEAGRRGKVIDGHAPFLRGNELNAYVCSGVWSDHECSDAGEALEKLGRGQWIMIREGTAARNLEALMPLFEAPYYERCMLVTDDKHPGDLISMGHIDYIIRRAVSLGADPIRAIKMGTFNAARYFGLKDRGAVMPGLRADLAVLEDLKDIRVAAVYKDGVLMAKEGVCLGAGKEKKRNYAAGEEPRSGSREDTESAEKTTGGLETAFPRVFNSFHMDEVTLEDLVLEQKGAMERVIQFKPHELLTEERLVPWQNTPGLAPGVSLEQDIVKAAVFERHLHTGHKGLGFVGGYGLKKGAVATSVAHDSHNLIVVGTNDRDMVLAANAVRKNRGGLAVAAEGQVLGELALPIGGVMSRLSVEEVEEQLQALKVLTRQLGISSDIDAFMTLAFVSLPVIPKLRINTYGVIDVDRQKQVPPSF